MPERFPLPKGHIVSSTPSTHSAKREWFPSTTPQARHRRAKPLPTIAVEKASSSLLWTILTLILATIGFVLTYHSHYQWHNTLIAILVASLSLGGEIALFAVSVHCVAPEEDERDALRRYISWACLSLTAVALLDATGFWSFLAQDLLDRHLLLWTILTGIISEGIEIVFLFRFADYQITSYQYVYLNFFVAVLSYVLLDLAFDWRSAAVAVASISIGVMIVAFAVGVSRKSHGLVVFWYGGVRIDVVSLLFICLT
jgi:hypothetical protein